ncbi:TPA: hypothetical protein P0E15_003390 [Vibrio harveyi]|nr:hypothetical protein [Vibrio harveyi]
MDIELRTVRDDVDYWVVRAGKGGRYLENFLEGKIASIGHMDGIELSPNSLTTENLSNTLSKLTAKLKSEEKKKGTINAIVSQARKFVTDIKVGDIIISVDENRMVAGVVESDVYVDSKTIKIYDVHGEPIGHELQHLVRRKVKWDNFQRKVNVPQSVKTSLKANQTLFCVTEHWRTLNHWLSVIFQKEDSLYFSTRIDTQDAIHNLDINEYTTALIQAEAISSYLSEGNNLENELDEEELSQAILNTYAKMKADRSFGITTQQSFMSPGDYWGELPGSDLKRAVFVAVFACLLNVNVVYAEDSQPVQLAKIQEVTKKVSKIISAENNLDIVKSNLSVRVPRQASLSDLDDLSMPEAKPDEFVGQ